MEVGVERDGDEEGNVVVVGSEPAATGKGGDRRLGHECHRRRTCGSLRRRRGRGRGDGEDKEGGGPTVGGGTVLRLRRKQE